MAKEIKKTETKAVTAREVSSVPALSQGEESWGSEGLDISDVLIPKILLMQSTSDLVKAEKVAQGSIVSSTTQKVLAKRGDSIDIIPICTYKGWRIMQKEKGKFEFVRNEPLTPENKNRVLEWEENGSEWRADRSLNFFVLLPHEVEAEKAAQKSFAEGKVPDFSGLLTPYLLQFLRTSYNAGKQLSTHFAMAKNFRQPPALWYLKLSAKSITNDLGTFYAYEISPGGVSEPEHVKKAREWYEIMRASEVKIHEADTAETPSDTAEADISNPSDKY